MSAAVALRPLWLTGITECKGERRVTTDSFLRARTSHINSQPTGGAFTLYIPNQKKLIELFCHEAERFASAAFESLVTQAHRPEHPKSTGWLLIRGYYAAFFALHALMRLHGWACTRISPEASALLDRNARIIYPDCEKIEGGLYLAKTTNKSPELAFKALGAKSGGSHEALWSLMSMFLRETSAISLTESVDDVASQQLVSAIDSLEKLIASRGGVVWLTRVRNRVNYAHEYGTWHPYNQSTCNATRIQAVLDRWKDEPFGIFSNTTKDELLQFCEVCAFLVSLCRATAKDLAYRSRANSPFKRSAVSFAD